MKGGRDCLIRSDQRESPNPLNKPAHLNLKQRKRKRKRREDEEEEEEEGEAGESQES